MAFKVVVPAVGESVQEGMIHKWHKQDGESVAVDDVLLELETDKATVEIVAEHAGVIRHTRKQGETVRVGDELATIDPDASASVGAPAAKSAAAPAAEAVRATPPPPPPPQQTPPPRMEKPSVTPDVKPLSPAVQRIVAETGVNPAQISGTGRDGRITKGDVIEHLNTSNASSSPANTNTALSPKHVAGSRPVTRESMSMLRRRIAQRLLEAQTTNAILTTFNEVDMSAIMKLRATYKDRFKEKHGVGLGFMSFFVKAAIDALKAFPLVNGHIDGNDIVKYGYYDVGVAISTDRGLMVPVIRDADHLDFAGIESAIIKYAEKARAGKITVEDLSGGTFTVTNGGVFGSLVSTPIINPPQSAILGMHKIQDRPMAVNGEVVIRPMMYLALSYDHRIIDGKEAVGFLVKIKDAIEDPSRLLLGL